MRIIAFSQIYCTASPFLGLSFPIEGPGFESAWPCLVGQIRAWHQAGPAGVLALLPPSPVTGGSGEPL